MVQPFFDTIHKEARDWSRIFWGCVALNVLAYGTYIVNVTYAVDDYGTLYSTINPIGSARWLGMFIHNVLCQTSFMPTLIPILAIVCYVLTGIGLCKLWEVKKNLSWLVIGLWSLHPYLLDAYNFRRAAHTFAIVYLLSIITLHLTTMKAKGFIASVLLFYITLSGYQPAFGFTIAAIMIQLLLKCYRDNFSSSILRRCGKLLMRYLLMLICSIILYAVVTTVLIILFEVKVTPRVQAGFVSNFSDLLYSKLPGLLLILTTRLLPIKEYVLPAAGKWLIFILYLLAILSVFRRGFRKSSIVLAILWICLIPFGAVSWSIPIVHHGLSWRTCMGLVVFVSGMFVLTQESRSVFIRKTGFFTACTLIVLFVLTSNSILYKQLLLNQKDAFMANRIISRIENLDAYRPGLQLAIVGSRDESQKLSKTETYTWNALRQSLQYQSSKRYSIHRGAFETHWSKYGILLNYLDLDLRKRNPENMNKARISAVGRKAWPDPSSVFIQDDMVIVILSLPDE